MPIFDTVREAWSILTRNKVRSFLTMLGIIIGVTSVVVIMSVGAGAQGLVLNQVKSLGSNLVGVLPGKSDDNGPPASVLGIIVTTLTTEDAEAFVGPEFPHVSASTPYVRGNATFTSGDNQTDANYVGVSASYPLVEEITVGNGRFFTAEEDKGVARVVVLGSEIAEKLFGDLDPIGRLIKIKRVSFRVIGEKAGLGTATVYRALRGEEFNSGTLEKLSTAFGCNPIDLLDVDEYRTPLVEAQGGAFLLA
jgi:putative ABC transport system permease protein